MEIKTAVGLPFWIIEMLNKGDMKKASFSKYGKAYEGIMKGQSYGNDFLKYNDRNSDSSELYDKFRSSIGSRRSDGAGSCS